MDKNEVVEILKELPERIAAVIMPSDRFFDYKGALDFAIKTIETDGWIPVSERLPEDRKKVRVTAYWHERFQVMDASYYGDGVWWCVPFNNCGEHMRNDLHVIAWKPDDEPYKESEAINETNN